MGLTAYLGECICWDGGEENGIDAVEDATVTGDDVATVLHASLAFEKGFCEVTHQSKDLDNERKHDPSPYRHSCLLEKWDIRKSYGKANGKHTATKESLPCFARRDLWC